MLQLCPVLGDHTYSARVGTVLGQRFLLSVESTKPQRQVSKATCLSLQGQGWMGCGARVAGTCGPAVQLGIGRGPFKSKFSLDPSLAVAWADDHSGLMRPISSVRELKPARLSLFGTMNKRGYSRVPSTLS